MLKVSKLNPINILFAAIVISLAGFLGCDKTTNGSKAQTIKITSPAEGDTITGASFLLRFQTTNFTSGHVHIWVDVPDSIRVDANTTTSLECCQDTVTLYVPKDSLGNPVPGNHTVVVEGATEAHVDIEGMEDEVTFVVP